VNDKALKVMPYRFWSAYRICSSACSFHNLVDGHTRLVTVQENVTVALVKFLDAWLRYEENVPSCAEFQLTETTVQCGVC
jgi:hypothetical protein